MSALSHSGYIFQCLEDLGIEHFRFAIVDTYGISCRLKENQIGLESYSETVSTLFA